MLQYITGGGAGSMFGTFGRWGIARNRGGGLGTSACGDLANGGWKRRRARVGTITLLVLQMTLLLQIEKIGLDHHIPIIVFTQKKYSK